jgi:hypothetical protein
VKISLSEVSDYRITIIAYEGTKGEKGRVINRKYYSNFLMHGCESNPQDPCNIAELKTKPIDPVFMETTGSGDEVYIVVKGYKSTSSREKFMKIDSISVFGDELETTNPIAVLPGPELLEPKDGAQFNHFPRTTVLSWNSVSNAASYSVEIESCTGSGVKNCSLSRFEDNIRGTRYEFGFVGAQWGRWRVYAVDKDQLSSKPSTWSTFRYNK